MGRKIIGNGEITGGNAHSFTSVLFTYDDLIPMKCQILDLVYLEGEPGVISDKSSQRIHNYSDMVHPHRLVLPIHMGLIFRALTLSLPLLTSIQNSVRLEIIRTKSIPASFYQMARS